MIITLTGENYFAIRLALDELVAKFVGTHSEMGLERIDGEEVDFDRISEALTSLPFLVPKKLVIFKNPSSKHFIEKHEELLNNLPETTDLVLVDSRLDKRTALYKYLKKSTDYREFNNLKGPELASWLVERARKSGGKLNTSSANILVAHVGEDQQMLAGELDKLLIHSSEITSDDIELLVEKTPQSKIFDMLDAVLAGDRRRAMEIYREQLAMRVAPQEIIGMLGWQLKVLAIIKTAPSASDTGLNPYVVRKSSVVASRLSLDQIKQYINNLLELDVQLKSQTIDADAALGQYLLELAR